MLTLARLAGEFEICMDGWLQYYNKRTDEFVSLPSCDNMYVERTKEDLELAVEIDGSEDYIRLPDQYELREFDIMEAFADVCPNQHQKQKLYQALNVRRPFRHFKDTINYLGISEAYYAFRLLSFCEIARRWCVDNEIAYADESPDQ